VPNQAHTSGRCHCHRKGIGAMFKLVLNDWQLCTCQEKKNAFLNQVFRKYVFQIASHWIFVIYHHNTLFTWLSYRDENVKHFLGFTYNAVMSVLKIIRCNTLGQDTCVSVSVHLFHFVTCVLKIQDNISVTDSPPVKKGEETYFIIVAHKILLLRSEWAITAPTYHLPYSSLYKPHTKVNGFHLGFLTHEDGTDGLSRNVGKQIPPVAAKVTHPQECSPRLICRGSLWRRNTVTMFLGLQISSCQIHVITFSY
jgi:hypothetical protein